MNAVEKAWDKIEKSNIFRLDGPEIDLCDAINKLCDAVNETDDDDWVYIGERGECSVPDFLIGAYWALTEWHSGQSSPEYAAMCAIGAIYKPNMANGPEPESSEVTAYDMASEYFRCRN